MFNGEIYSNILAKGIEKGKVTLKKYRR